MRTRCQRHCRAGSAAAAGADDIDDNRTHLTNSVRVRRRRSHLGIVIWLYYNRDATLRARAQCVVYTIHIDMNVMLRPPPPSSSDVSEGACEKSVVHKRR